jgi:hypothetical protein
MTKKKIINLLLIAVYTAAIFILGCIPEDSLQWSADGSTGIYSKEGALFLVDGNAGSLTQIADEETTTPWPAISPDGKHLAYGQIIPIENFVDALNLLPPGQVKMLQNHAVAVKENFQRKIGEESIVNKEVLNKGLFADNVLKSYNEEYRNWVVHYLFEKLDGDGTIAKNLGTETVEKALEKSVNYHRLILAPTDDPNSKTVVTTSIQRIWKISFSPDGKLLAYVTDPVTGDPFETGFNLYVVSPYEDIPTAFVDSGIAIGYEFRPDSRAIAYLKPDDENFNRNDNNFVRGSLIERIIISPDGQLLASPADLDDNDPPMEYKCTGTATELAGILYYPWMKVSYTLGNRIFFSSAKVSLPCSKIDSEIATIFCCDTYTGAVSEILPQIAVEFSQGNCYIFALSHDHKKILLPGNKNTLGLYALGRDFDSSKILIDDNEGFGEGENPPPNLVAQWKGSDEVSCLVSEKSHYLTNDPNSPARRKEIVILDTQGKLQKVLSKDWPDELVDF